jgi:hypothetical protein
LAKSKIFPDNTPSHICRGFHVDGRPSAFMDGVDVLMGFNASINSVGRVKDRRPRMVRTSNLKFILVCLSTTRVQVLERFANFLPCIFTNF